MKEEDLQLVLVRYGSDTGLISLAAGTILCHTVETGDGGLEWPKGIPVVDFSDESQFSRLLGQDSDEPEHDWDDVLAYVLGHRQELGLEARPVEAKDDIHTPLEDLLSRYAGTAGTDLGGAIRDLLTELMCLCDDRGMDFDDRLDQAQEVYQEEREKKDQL